MKFITRITQFVFIGAVAFFALTGAALVSAQQPLLSNPDITVFSTPDPLVTPDSSTSAQATDSAVPATASKLQQEAEDKAEQKAEKDITSPTGPAKSALSQYLDDNKAQELSFLNPVQHAIRYAVNNGIPANLLVLLLLFPVVASLVAVFRHVIGLSGFGVYAPAALAVTFVSTGITVGLLMFVIILVATTLGRIFVLKFKLQYLPRTSLLLWFVSLSVFGFLLIAPALKLNDLALVGFFPILILVLLSENVMEAQMTSTFVGSMQKTLETLILSILSAVVMQSIIVQQFVILYPEYTILGVFFFNILIGKYTGLRVLEYIRFKQVLDTQEE
jgi:hypothetical protein